MWKHNVNLYINTFHFWCPSEYLGQHDGVCVSVCVCVCVCVCVWGRVNKNYNVCVFMEMKGSVTQYNSAARWRVSD